MSRCRLCGHPLVGLGGTGVSSFWTRRSVEARAAAGPGHRIPTGRPASGAGAVEHAPACASPSKDATRRPHMNVLRGAVRLPSANDSIAPVRILDAAGCLVCVISAEEFRRTHPTIDTPDSTPTGHHRRLPDRPGPRSVPSPPVHALVRPAERPIAGTEAVTLERVE